MFWERPFSALMSTHRLRGLNEEIDLKTLSDGATLTASGWLPDRGLLVGIHRTHHSTGVLTNKACASHLQSAALGNVEYVDNGKLPAEIC